MPSFAYLFVVWPSSKPKLADFKEKIRTTLFAPTLNTRVRIVCEDYEISTFPLTPCKDCARLYANSGLVQVNLNITTYNLLHTVSMHVSLVSGRIHFAAICIHPSHMLLLLKGPPPAPADRWGEGGAHEGPLQRPKQRHPERADLRD